VNIDTVDLEIIWLKLKKYRNAWQSIAYSPIGNVVLSPSEYL